MNYPRKVYAIRHEVTNRVYIGSSCHVDRRFMEHLTALRANRHPVADMQADFDKYGEKFTITVLDHIASEREKEKEFDWMDKNQSWVRGVGYNYNDRKWLGRNKNIEDSTPSERALTEVLSGRSSQKLNDDERELIKIIRTAPNPTKAMIDSVLIIAQFLSPQSVTEFITRGQEIPHSMK